MNPDSSKPANSAPPAVTGAGREASRPDELRTVVHDLRNTAVVQEIDGGYFAVDPMLAGFAEPPPILPLTDWLAAWPPDLSKNDARAQPGKKPEPAPSHQLRVEAEKPTAAPRRL